MKSSPKLLNEPIGRKGFAELSVEELFKGPLLVEVVTEKVNALGQISFSERELERDVRLLMGLLRETLSRRYVKLSVLAFAHILVALDHFVKVKDKAPDTHIGGYADDLIVIRQVLREFREEIDQFQAWARRMEKKP